MKVLLDSNALHGDLAMVQTRSQRMLRLLAPAEAVLVFSPLVLAELERQRLEEVADLRDSVGSRLRRLGRLAGADVGEVVADVNEIADRGAKRWRERWEEVLSSANVELAGWPAIDSKSMAERELSRRRPFLDREPGTIGHRDTLIWLSVVELVREAVDEEVVFVTSDRGFLDGRELHPDLAADLRPAEMDRLTVVRDINELSALLVAADTGAWRDWREPEIENLIAEKIAALTASDFTPAYDPREGDYGAPTFDIGLPHTGHDWTLEHIEGPTDLHIEQSEYGTSTVSCTFNVAVTLGGFMDKWEWYGAEHPEVDLWDGDWNDHLVAIEATPLVHMSATVRVSDDTQTVDFVDFTGAAGEGPPGSIALG